MISLMYVAADKPAGEEGAKKTCYRNNTFMYISSFYQKNLEAHFGVFYPIFPRISEVKYITFPSLFKANKLTLREVMRFSRTRQWVSGMAKLKI